jgi:hypothetical protein
MKPRDLLGTAYTGCWMEFDTRQLLPHNCAGIPLWVLSIFMIKATAQVIRL